ncbi:MAG: hypothetical protein NTY19_48715 [Planctomycetota bacterium]|nr:hypothetical protein [Planctomycetota bacterium]
MPSRSQRSPQERDARSRVVKRVAEQLLLRGCLVQMARTCGKTGCCCQQGEKHVSLYLAIRRGRKRTMIYIPSALEETVRQWAETGREVEELLDFISQQSLDQLLQQGEGTRTRTRDRSEPSACETEGTAAVMHRSCAYVDKVFPFQEHLQGLTDSRPQPIIPTASVFLTAFVVFATHRPSLHALEPDLHLPARFRGLVGPRVPSSDTTGRVYAQLARLPTNI